MLVQFGSLLPGGRGIHLHPSATVVHLLQAMLLQEIGGLATAIATGAAKDQGR
jgi:hypothetical protein